MDPEEIGRRAEHVVKEYNGILPYTEAFYIRSILYSADRSRDAFQRFEIGRSVNDTETNQVSAIHEALGHAAGLSKFFWPPKGRDPDSILRLREARAEKLRSSFELAQDSPLSDRRLRNSLEHFDERLDAYLLENEAGRFFPDARVARLEGRDAAGGHFFKLVDPEEARFLCLGEIYDFAPIMAEVDRVYEGALSMDENGGRLGEASDDA